MSENLAKKVREFKESGEKYDTWKLAKSYNLGRILLALLGILAVILIYLYR